MSNPRLVRRFTHSRPGRWLCERLDNWKPWVVVLAAGLIAVNVWTLTIYRTQARDEAAHAAEIVANADGQFHSCNASIPLLTQINAYIVGDRIIREALVENSRANLDATPTDSPLYKTRLANYRRLVEAKDAAFQVQFPVPTATSCKSLRTRLLKSH